MLQIDGLVQERCNSSALAMELRLSFTNPSKYNFHHDLDFKHSNPCFNEIQWRPFIARFIIANIL